MEAQHVSKIEWSQHFVNASVCTMSHERIPCFLDPHDYVRFFGGSKSV